MSALKLINKVVLRNSAEISGICVKKPTGDKLVQQSEEADLFFSTFGISADPLAQFAVVFAALVHDVDHRGVPNVQLIKEKPLLGDKYNCKSVAENNSIRVAWSELMRSEFSNLRRCIFASEDDETRFRQLLINVVIATDITDRERRAGERLRWETAFGSNSDDMNWEQEWQNKTDDQLPDIDISLKATVVLEQIVLASDVAHTMQHWLTYVKWNERLYKEMWAAYAGGRAEKDPTEGWYKGEIGFFDGYIIPLVSSIVCRSSAFGPRSSCVADPYAHSCLLHLKLTGYQAEGVWRVWKRRGRIPGERPPEQGRMDREGRGHRQRVRGQDQAQVRRQRKEREEPQPERDERQEQQLPGGELLAVW